MLSAHGINAKHVLFFLKSNDGSEEESVTSLDSLLDLLQSNIHVLSGMI